MKTPTRPPEPDVTEALIGIIASMLIVTMNNAADVTRHTAPGSEGRSVWETFRKAITDVQVIDHGDTHARSVLLHGNDCDYRVIIRKEPLR
jgi:hypothetical protein